MSKAVKIKGSVLKRILKDLKGYRLKICLSIVLAAATVALTLCIPILVGKAVDCIVGQRTIEWDELNDILRIIAAAVAGTAVFQFAMNLINNKITYGVTKELRERAFASVLKLPISHVDSHPHGDIMSRIVSDADTFADGLLMGFTQLFTGVLTIIGTIVFMATINIVVTGLVVILTPLSFAVASFIANRTHGYFKAQAALKGQEVSIINEMVSAQEIVRYNNYTSEALSNHEKVNKELKEASLKAVFFSSLTNPVTRFVNSLIYDGVIAFGAILAVNGSISVGALTSFLSYASSYSKPFNEISGVFTELSNAISCAERIYELIDMKPAVDEGTAGVVKFGKVEITNVDFSYDKSKKLIENLNLTVKPGQKVAIVGPTGGGKSTIINLLMRFYEIDGGSIKIDGVDIRDMSLKALRESFGMVLQETWLKEGTIKENLRIQNKDATDEEIIAAAKAAHAHSFIKRLPQGYDTVITENGENLSVGQRQLLCIARVMLNLPPMLILDEATSSIDTRTEQKIQAAFNTMMQGRTTFVVAHRLSTIKNADIILFVKDGKVMEQGDHAFLLRKGDFYAKLYQSQFEENTLHGTVFN